MKNVIAVGLGGLVGSLLRYGISMLSKSNYFPLGTFLVNIIGSFIIGCVFAYSIKHPQFSTEYKLLLGTGICGGFTTFSTFSLEAVQMLQQQRYQQFFIYITASLLLGFLATFAGVNAIK